MLADPDDRTPPPEVAPRDPDRAARQREVEARAESEIARRRPGSLTFRSVGEALGWYYRTRALMDGANAGHPRTYTARDGSEVHVRVDGGRGGDLHEVLATMMTIGGILDRILDALEAGARPHGLHPREYRWVLAAYHGVAEPPPGWTPGCGRSLRWTQSEIGERYGVDQSTVSRAIGRIEAVMADALRGGGVVG